jgi:hypothetical protein
MFLENCVKIYKSKSHTIWNILVDSQKLYYHVLRSPFKTHSSHTIVGVTCCIEECIVEILGLLLVNRYSYRS